MLNLNLATGTCRLREAAIPINQMTENLDWEIIGFAA